MDDFPWQTWFDQAFPRPSPDPTGAPVVRHLAEQAADQPEQAADKPRGRKRAFSQPANPGKQRCTAHRTNGQPCGNWASPGSNVCRYHGAAAPQVREKALARVQEAEAAKIARKYAGNLDLTPYQSPVEALQFVVSYNFALCKKLADQIESIPVSQIRYQGKLAEQVRGELTAYSDISRNLTRTAIDAMKLGLEERRAVSDGAAAEYLERIKSAVVNLARQAVYVAVADPSDPDKAIAQLEANLQELIGDA